MKTLNFPPPPPDASAVSYLDVGIPGDLRGLHFGRYRNRAAWRCTSGKPYPKDNVHVAAGLAAGVVHAKLRQANDIVGLGLAGPALDN